MAIKDFVKGDMISAVLLVANSSVLNTKRGKPYLSVTLSDGVSTINGKHWDWSLPVGPDTGKAVAVTAQVDSWEDALQLNIKQLEYADVDLAIFIPQPPADIDTDLVYAHIVDTIKDSASPYLQFALYCFTKLQDKWKTAPSAVGVHHAYRGGNIVHAHEVATHANNIALGFRHLSAIDIDVDLVQAGALLHDIGKLYTYTFAGPAIVMTPEGQLLDHITIGTQMLVDMAHTYNTSMHTGDCTAAPGTPLTAAELTMLQHIILAHHGKLEYGSPVLPACIEAHIVHAADRLSVAGELIRANTKDGEAWTPRIWALDNKAHIVGKLQ